MNEGRRPDPDELLRRIQQAERRQGRGRFLVFLGAAPGVGKTYKMLLTARAAAAQGLDVVVGLVETHGRAETEALLEGLTVLPRSVHEHRGLRLTEFDLDGALARHPALLLIDELAHSNAPGCRHAKRWQDVEELLDAGISVHTTLNVQHLESLNDVVSGITGAAVNETVPDRLLEQADEVELVDLSPDELLVRLGEGKVYVPQQAALAKERFFRKGNLIALRELALRRTAARVDAQMAGYREEHGISSPWQVGERVLVGIGPSPSSARLVRAAARLAAELHGELFAVSIEPPEPRSAEDAAQVAAHLGLAERLGARVFRLSGERVSDELLVFARQFNVTRIVVGKPTHPRWRDRLRGSLVEEIIRGSGGIDVQATLGEPEQTPVVRPPTTTLAAGPHARTRPVDAGSVVGRALAALGVVGLATAVGLLLRGWFFELADVAMLYVLTVLLFALRVELRTALFASVLSVAALDFFFVVPFYTFSVDNLRHNVTFGVLLVVAAVTSSLTVRLRQRAEAARESARLLTAQHALASELAAAASPVELVERAAERLQELLGQPVVLFGPVPGPAAPAAAEPGAALPAVIGGPGATLDAREHSVARWVLQHGTRAGRGTDTLAGAAGLYLPLSGSRRPLAVLGLYGPDAAATLRDPHRRQWLETLATTTALALERSSLAAAAERARLETEEERLRNVLLSSVSHDLRTPLAVITGAASVLVDDPALGPEVRREMAQTIAEEAERLERQVTNLLDLSRLESGARTVHREWLPFEEVVGVALARLARSLREQRVEVELPADLPLVLLDPLLIEVVLVNLLDNAVKHAGRGRSITVRAAVTDGELTCEVADRGPGLPPGEEQQIFTKFHRGGPAGRGDRRTPGAGLGLTICRMILEAHGGTITAAQRQGGGACFRFTLPRVGEPPTLDEAPEENGAADAAPSTHGSGPGEAR